MHLLLQENPDLFKWLTGQQAAPDHLTRNSAYQVSATSVRQHSSCLRQDAAQRLVARPFGLSLLGGVCNDMMIATVHTQPELATQTWHAGPLWS